MICRCVDVIGRFNIVLALPFAHAPWCGCHGDGFLRRTVSKCSWRERATVIHYTNTNMVTRFCTQWLGLMLNHGQGEGVGVQSVQNKIMQFITTHTQTSLVLCYAITLNVRKCNAVMLLQQLHFHCAGFCEVAEI